jgi:hypothetical protein
MAGKLTIRDTVVTVPISSPLPTDEIHIIGLKKTGPNRYALVTGTVSHPVVDTVSNPLEYVAETIKKAIIRLLEVVP